MRQILRPGKAQGGASPCGAGSTSPKTLDRGTTGILSAENAIRTEPSEIHVRDSAILNVEPKRISEIYTKEQTGALYNHLHNSNGETDWVMAFTDRKTARKNFVKSKKIPVSRGISWAMASIYGPDPKRGKIAFAPYSRNRNGSSRWGGFDFDAHDGNVDRARRLAFRAYQQLLNTGLHIILETSGGNGWHVWAIAREFKPCSFWNRLLTEIADEIGANIQAGVCEILPPDSLSPGVGKAMRAPGSWHPGTQNYSEIVLHDSDKLIREIGLSSNMGSSSPIEKENSLSFLSLAQGMRFLGRSSEDVEINSQSIRHERLTRLVGIAFPQISRSVLLRLAECQFREKQVHTQADAQDHLKEFEDCHAGLLKRWRTSQSSESLAVFDGLATETQRDAFRVIQGFAQLARKSENPDFPIACDNLAKRLNITRRGAGELRNRFVDAGILSKTAAYKPNVAAARYCWRLSLP